MFRKRFAKISTSTRTGTKFSSFFENTRNFLFIWEFENEITHDTSRYLQALNNSETEYIHVVVAVQFSVVVLVHAPESKMMINSSSYKKLSYKLGRDCANISTPVYTSMQWQGLSNDKSYSSKIRT